MCKNKNYSINFTTEQFLMLYSILLQINYEMYKTDDNYFRSSCLFSFDDIKGEKKTFKELSDIFNNYRPRRLI